VIRLARQSLGDGGCSFVANSSWFSLRRMSLLRDKNRRIMRLKAPVRVQTSTSQYKPVQVNITIEYLFVVRDARRPAKPGRKGRLP
jgi:hypothetical protein